MLTHQEVVAGLSDEHLSNLAGNIEVGNLGSSMASAHCAAGCAMTPASATDFLSRYSGWSKRPDEVRKLEWAYMGIHGFERNQLYAPELYQLVIQEQALRAGRTIQTEELVSV